MVLVQFQYFVKYTFKITTVKMSSLHTLSLYGFLCLVYDNLLVNVNVLIDKDDVLLQLLVFLPLGM